MGIWAPSATRPPDDDHGELPSLRDFIEASAAQRARLAAALECVRADWDVDRLAEQIADRAARLDRTQPLISATEFVPEERWWRGEEPGYVRTYGWADPVTVVGGNAQRWNGFDDHRPAIVGLIIRKLLTVDDPDSAACEVLSDDGIVHLERADGPAGPIHLVTVNGTHRTHALRILDAPLLAAEITITALPLRLHESSMSEQGFTVSAEPYWRGLIRRNLLVADILHGKHGAAVLEPHHVVAPWLLRAPSVAIEISAAYQRIYPGALNIPAQALVDRAAWCGWLES